MPDWRPTLLARLASLGLDPAREAEITEELSQHLDDAFRDALARGLTPADAEAAALEPLADEAALLEALRVVERRVPAGAAADGSPAPRRLIAALAQDLRFALRLLERRPGFAAATILTLSLGIGANATIFSALDAVLLRPLPYPQPHELVTYWGTAPEKGLPEVSMPPGLFAYHRAGTSALATLAAYERGGQNLSGDGEAERVETAYVTFGFFETLGVPPRLGRTFRLDEERGDGPRVAILSDGLWRRRYGADAAIVGRAIRLNELPTTVVGVMPPGFDFPGRIQIWMPERIDPAQFNCWCLSTIGRVRPGRTAEQVRADLARLTDDFGMRRRDIFPNAKPGGSRFVVVPIDVRLTGEVRAPMLVLMAAAGLVLLIVCANIANLLLSRATLRMREFALRISLGATRRRLAAQLMAESFLLAFLGMLGALAIAWWVLRVMRNLPTTLIPRIDEVGLNPAVLAFTAGAAILTGALCGIGPALRTMHVAPQGGMADDGRSGRTRGGRRLRDLFVALQLALSLVLLTGAGLLLRSFVGIVNIDPGYATRNVLTARVAVPYVKYPSDTTLRQLYAALEERVRAIPGVLATGFAHHVPLSSGNHQDNVLAEGQEPRAGEPVLVANIRIVSAGYFDAIGTPILRGRAFTTEDGYTRDRVVIVDETFAQHYWPNEDPIGKRVRHGGDQARNPWLTIVGVVPNIRHSRLDEDRSLQVYEPYGQQTTWSMYLTVRSRVPAAGVIPAIRAQLAALDPAVPLSEVRTMEQAVAESLGTRRLTNVLLVAFAITAAFLAAIGIYGVISLNVSARLREFGVRLALGARPRDLRRLVLRQGFLLAAVGVATGVAGSLWLTPLLRTLLYGVSPFDPVTFAAVAVGLTMVVVVACVVPARRAMRADPTEAMRAE